MYRREINILSRIAHLVGLICEDYSGMQVNKTYRKIHFKEAVFLLLQVSSHTGWTKFKSTFLNDVLIYGSIVPYYRYCAPTFYAK